MIYKKRVIDARKAEELARCAEQHDGWEDGGKTAGKNIRDKKRNEQLFFPDNAYPWWIKTIAHAMMHESMINTLGPYRIGLPRVSRYKQGGYYDWHVDAAHSDDVRRIDISLSLLLQRCAPGGGAMFFRVGDVEVRLDPEPGELVCFASHLEHRIETVGDGVRIVGLGFGTCVVQDPIERELLGRSLRGTDDDRNWVIANLARRVGDSF